MLKRRTGPLLARSLMTAGSTAMLVTHRTPWHQTPARYVAVLTTMTRCYATGPKKPHSSAHQGGKKGHHGEAPSQPSKPSTPPVPEKPATEPAAEHRDDASSTTKSQTPSEPQGEEREQQQRSEQAAGEETPQEEATSLDEKEATEREKDERFARNLKIGLAGFVLILPAFYLGNKWGKQAYWGSEGSVRLSQSARGKPSLGGPFSLVTHDGEPVTQAHYLGKWCFFYFGFVHCPEICPVELNRMTKVVNWVREAKPGVQLQPLFVSCDPKRDSLLAIKEYLSVFHPDFIGLVGTPEQVNETCKSYRIYYSVPTADQGKGDDYLIDHSIAIFLFDPKGQFVDFFGTRYTEEEIRDKVLTYISKFEADPTWTNW